MTKRKSPPFGRGFSTHWGTINPIHPFYSLFAVAAGIPQKLKTARFGGQMTAGAMLGPQEPRCFRRPIGRIVAELRMELVLRVDLVPSDFS